MEELGEEEASAGGQARDIEVRPVLAQLRRAADLVPSIPNSTTVCEVW